MFRRVLVGFDGSAQSADAAALGLLLGGGELTLACVHGRARRDEAASMLEDARHRLSLDGRVRTATMPDRSVAKGLQELSRAGQSDLIVVGSTHRGTVGRVLAGSVAERLLQGSPVPVAVAPLGFADVDEELGVRILGVAYDGGAEAEAALDAAVAFAAESGATLRVVAVAESLPRSAPGPLLGGSLPMEDDKAWLDAKLTAALERTPPDVRAAGKVLKGDPATVIVGEAEAGMDVLFCGSRRYGPMRAVLLGGVSSRLMRLCPCPVIVFPRPSQDEPEIPAGAAGSGERGGTR